MSTPIDPELKKFAEQFNLDYEMLAKEAPEINNLAEQTKDKAPAPKEYTTLPDGRYSGRVFIEVSQVKNEGKNFGKLMLKFSLKVSEGEYLNRYDYLYFVIAPAHLAEPKSGQSKESWEKAKEDYWLNIMKTLQNCGVEINWENEWTTFANAANARGNVVQFTVKTNNDRRYVYIDRLIERAEKPVHSDSTDDLFNLPEIPHGDDAPFGEPTGVNS
jgi:hypothetical protein